MSIIASEIEFRYSGGAANTDPNACLGGAISTAGAGLIDDNVKNDLWDDVSSAEASAGDTEYRGFYVKNTNGSLTWQDSRIYISSLTSSADDEFDLAVAAEAMNVTMATITNEATAPATVTFTRPTTYAGGLQLNGTTGLTTGSYRGVWIRRTVGAAAAAATNDTGTIKCEGDTA